jgi:hypothetical protein
MLAMPKILGFVCTENELLCTLWGPKPL